MSIEMSIGNGIYGCVGGGVYTLCELAAKLAAAATEIACWQGKNAELQKELGRAKRTIDALLDAREGVKQDE